MNAELGMMQSRSIWICAELGHSDGDEAQPLQEHTAGREAVTQTHMSLFCFSCMICTRVKSSLLAVHFAQTETCSECNLKTRLLGTLNYQYLASVCSC